MTHDKDSSSLHSISETARATPDRAPTPPTATRPSSSASTMKKSLTLDEFVKKLGGDFPISKILIANNGIAAVKAIRSIRRWAYQVFGNERRIQFVAMATPEDLKANAEYIRMADEFVEVPGRTNNNNYANVELIVEVAELTGVNAVWAGWGHASENPRLPDLLNKCQPKIAFIGPQGEAMRALGDKIGSTIIAQSAGVPTYPWSGDGLTCCWNKEGIPDDVYHKAQVHTVEEAVEVVDRIGFPVMVKASEGGGGKGIRKAYKMETLKESFRQVQEEVPGSPIFIMQLSTKCRHLEVQLIADKYGNATALHSRDCSVQRRHQKIIEEGPVVAAPPHVLEKLEKAAVALAKEVGYQGAGTVEYLFTEEQEYYFLELNPRLQVEHPVTEWITGVNLPAMQLNIAMGIPLFRIPDIRAFYGEQPYTHNPIDFTSRKPCEPRGHVIAVRITSENPDEGFKPTSGAIQELNFRSTPDVWGYFSIGAHGGVHEYADSQFGHLFAWGVNRDDARKSMCLALKELSIRGDIRTTVEYLVELLETPDFKENHIDTTWLDGRISRNVTSRKPDTWLALICGAIHRANDQNQKNIAQFTSLLERGLYPPNDLLKVDFDVELIYSDEKYAFKMVKTGPNGYRMSIGASYVDVQFRNLNDGGCLILIDGKSHVAYGKEEVTGLRLNIDGKTCVFTSEYDPTKLCTSVAGKLTRYLVENEAHVQAGEPYAEMEVMKMCLPLLAPEDGTVTLQKSEGSILEAGDLLATLHLDDPSRVRKSILFTGQIPAMKEPSILSMKPHHSLRMSTQRLQMILQGFHHDVDLCLSKFFDYLYDNAVPIMELQEILAVLEGRIPSKIMEKIHNLKDDDTSVDTSTRLSTDLRKVLDQHAESLPWAEREIFANTTAELTEWAHHFANGVKGNACRIIGDLLLEYVKIEKLFGSAATEDVLDSLRAAHKSDINDVVDILRAHHAGNPRNTVTSRLLQHIGDTDTVAHYLSILDEIVNLQDKVSSPIALQGRQLLVQHSFPSFEKRKEELEEHLRITSSVTDPEQTERINSLVKDTLETYDVLVTFFHHPNTAIQEVALKVYIGRAYIAYDLADIGFDFDSGFVKAHWNFRLKASNRQDTTTNPLLRGSSRHLFDSTDDLPGLKKAMAVRSGSMAVFQSEAEFYSDFSNTITWFGEEVTKAQKTGEVTEPINVVNVAVHMGSGPTDDQAFAEKINEFLSGYRDQLKALNVASVTVIATRDRQLPYYYTFRNRLEFQEDPIYRHIEPSLAFLLDLKRLSNFDIQFIPTDNREIHIYYGSAPLNTQGVAANVRATHDRRFFVRSVIRSATFFDTQANFHAPPECERIIVDSLDALEVAAGSGRFEKAQFSQIFLNILPTLEAHVEKISLVIKTIVGRYVERFSKLRINCAEVHVNLQPSPDVPPTNYRLVVNYSTGQSIRIDVYQEAVAGASGDMVFKSVSGDGEWDGVAIAEPYPIISLRDRKNMIASTHDTVYVYNLPRLFRDALQARWEATEQALPKDMFHQKELYLDSKNELQRGARNAGLNDVGMVAWEFSMVTPECPKGRNIVVIANDITFQNGSFGTREDLLFKKASAYARHHGIPRIYITANSGARIGVAEEVKRAFKVCWVDESDPTKGFQYLYLDDATYQQLRDKKSVLAKEIDANGEKRWMITDIIGCGHDLGVENLRGSGMIAGETSLAADKIFTLTYVSGRTVGIGAYLARLGQRVIQKVGPPIILTGYGALNQVLGREVYMSNMQLGGTRVMYTNGVSHLACSTDLEGAELILDWLSYVPVTRHALPPIISSEDPVDRLIEWSPPKSAYDPRHLMEGFTSETGQWVSGFFDKGSFREYLGGWAKTVVVGRARLGGVPMGAIAVETRVVEATIPADPANPESTEQVIQQPGQVWYPDSAYKTAQALADMNKEGLPLMIFANWRGFSGGTRDMFDEVLKFGSYIVDNLRVYDQPVFMYIPPNGELRGGSWVVVDPTINPDMIEMYADVSSRGGVLEPNGTISIKYRVKDQLSTMHRVDAELIRLDAELSAEGLSTEARGALREAIKKREQILLPLYAQIATQFCDLHDTPGRMLSKGVISNVLEWKNSRTFFAHRVKRRLYEVAIIKSIAKVNPTLKREEAVELLKSEVLQGGQGDLWENDRELAEFLTQNYSAIASRIASLQKDYLAGVTVSNLKDNSEAVVAGLEKYLASATEEQVEALKQQLKAKLSL